MKSSIVMMVAISVSQLLMASGAWAALALPDAALAGKPSAAASAPATARKKDKARPSVKPVDINSASKAELMNLPGLSDADVERIAAGRPYLSKAHLVTRNVISEGQYLGIRSMIMARQKSAIAPKPTQGK